MEMIADPEMFETSQIVEKSSKSGIFSNKRLLVIKNGFLYYFTNVPTEYKSHVPDLLNTLKELPKSSIQIRKIYTIKLQSAKSSNLIINFYEKDMIDREDIRQSISTKTYSQPKKGATTELDQWKFTFPTVLQCRLWYSALVKLKKHFLKQNDKITEFMTNFDPERRASLNTLTVPRTVSTMIAIPPSVVEESRISMPIVPQKQPVYQVIIQEKDQDNQQDENSVHNSQHKSNNNSEHKSNNNSEHKSTNSNKWAQFSKMPSSKSSKFQQCQIQQQLSNKIRREEQKKADESFVKIKSELQERQKIIQRLQQQIEDNKQLNRQLQLKAQQESRKRIEQQKRHTVQQARRREELDMIKKQKEEQVLLHKPYELKQYSIQTEQQQQPTLSSHSPIKQFQMKSRLSIQSEQLLGKQRTQRDTITLFRSTMPSLSQREDVIAGYNLYVEVGLINLEQMKFTERIQREIRLVQYCQKLNKKAIEIVRGYIDEYSPTSSINFERGIFSVQLVCEAGKIVNIVGKEKLIYSNKVHQRLKRMFKIYNYLFNELLRMLRKKPSLQLRVPYCTLIEYRGYTALVSYLPEMRACDKERVGKPLKMLLAGLDEDRFEVREIFNRSPCLYMVTCKQAFKISSQSDCATFMKPLYTQDFLGDNRKRNVSLSCTFLEKQLAESKDKSDRIELVSILRLCRALKKIMKSTQPYCDNPRSQFFRIYLTKPKQILSLVLEEEQQVPVLNGYVLNYIEKIVGIRLNSQFNSTQQPSIEVVPVSRSFDLSGLQVNVVSGNFAKYCGQGRYNLAENSLQCLRGVNDNQAYIAISQATLMMKYKLHEQAIDKLNYAQQQCRLHEPARVEIGFMLSQCYIATGRQLDLLTCLRDLLELTEYMFKGTAKTNPYKLDVYLLIGESLVRQGQIPQAIGIYRCILSEDKEYKSSIYLNMSWRLREDHSADPHVLIEFLQELAGSIEIQSQLAPVWVHLAELYLLSYNEDKALGYFQKAYNYYLHCADGIDISCQIFAKLMQFLRTNDEKRSIHRQLCNIINGNPQYRHFGNHINTLVMLNMSHQYSQTQQQIVIDFLDQVQYVEEQYQVVEWEKLTGIIRKIVKKKEKLTEDEYFLLQRMGVKQLETELRAISLNKLI